MWISLFEVWDLVGKSLTPSRISLVPPVFRDKSERGSPFRTKKSCEWWTSTLNLYGTPSTVLYPIYLYINQNANNWCLDQSNDLLIKIRTKRKSKSNRRMDPLEVVRLGSSYLHPHFSRRGIGQNSDWNYGQTLYCRVLYFLVVSRQCYPGRCLSNCNRVQNQ